MKTKQSDEIGEDFPTKPDIEAAKDLARRVSPLMLNLLEAEETTDTTEKAKKNADSV